MADDDGKQQQQQQAGQQPGGDDPNKPQIEQEDLDLVPEGLEDEGKDEAALWSEFDAEESGEQAAPDDGAGGGGGDDAAAAGSDDEGAATTADDGGEQGSDDDSAAKPAGEQDPAGKSGDGGGKPPPDDGKAQDDQVWANATPEQRAAYDAAQQRLKKLEHAERSNRGRISALQRQIAELTGSQRQTQPAAQDGAAGGEDGGGQGSGTDGQGAGDGFLNSEDWTKFREEYPEVAGPLEKVVGGLQSEVTRQNKELAAIGEDRRQSALSEQAEFLAEEHADWQEVVADDGFVEWLEGQPRHIREAAIRNAEDIVDAQEAADVVGRFKAHRAEQQGGGNAQPTDTSRANGGDGAPGKQQQGRRQRQLESAAATRTTGPGVASGIPEDGDPETIWKQFDQMERRQAGGT